MNKDQIFLVDPILIIELTDEEWKNYWSFQNMNPKW